MNKTVVTITSVTVLSLITIGVLIYYNSIHNVENVVEYTPEIQVLLNPVEKRTLEIYQSEVFQSEMQMMAKARAMFELSIEKQAEALTLSENAQNAYDHAQSLESEWHDAKRGE